MKFKRNLLILFIVLIGILIVVAGCVPTTPTSEEEEAEDAPTNGTISVAAGAATTNDTTPTLTLSSTGATYMAFSGDGVNWSAWVAYATTYSSFGVTTGEGCTSGDGTKIVYVKFKNDDDVESTKVYDSFYLDTAAPTLTTAAYTDTGSGGTVNAADTVVFTFSDEMLTTTVTASTVATVLPLSSSKSYGTSPTVSWDSTLKICTVTLGTSPTLVAGTTTVTPTAAVKDSAGNAYASTTAVTISGTSSTTITTAAILGVTAPVTGATPVTTITAATQYTGTVTWSSTPTTFAASTAYTATITLTPTTGYTLTGVAANLFTVSGATTDTNSANSGVVTAVFPATAASSSTTADAAQLYVSAQNDNAKYTDVPTGGNIKVYAFASDNADSAVAAGVKGTITVDDTWTACSAFGHTDFIYFTLTTSGAMTSAVVSDGQIPAAPTAPALGSIQATSTTTVTSSAAGNLTTGDKIKCYVGSTAYSAATNVGTDMTLTTALVAADAPYYTKINTAGHESVVSSSADGAILILTRAVGANGGTAGTLDTGDTITLTYSGVVDVNLPIYVSNLTWTATGTAVFSAASEMLKNTDTTTDSTGVVLTAVTCTNFTDSAETVTFNVPTNVNIVDNTGGNFVLPWASDSAAHFDSGDF